VFVKLCKWLDCFAFKTFLHDAPPYVDASLYPF